MRAIPRRRPGRAGEPGAGRAAAEPQGAARRRQPHWTGGWLRGPLRRSGRRRRGPQDPGPDSPPPSCHHPRSGPRPPVAARLRRSGKTLACRKRADKPAACRHGPPKPGTRNLEPFFPAFPRPLNDNAPRRFQALFGKKLPAHGDSRTYVEKSRPQRGHGRCRRLTPCRGGSLCPPDSVGSSAPIPGSGGHRDSPLPVHPRRMRPLSGSRIGRPPPWAPAPY